MDDSFCFEDRFDRYCLCFSFPQALAIYRYKIITMVLTIIKPPMREKTHVCCVDLNTLVMQSNILCNVRNYEMSENKKNVKYCSYEPFEGF